MYRKNYNSYEEYTEHQIEKTAEPLREIRLKGHWNETKKRFVEWFECLDNYITTGKALCLGSRIGVEVEVLQDKGFDAIGIDLVAFPPYTVKGDFHDIPFDNNTFDLVFSNSIDHVYDLDKFCEEIKRVLKPFGYVLFNVCPGQMGIYESLRIDDIDELISVFNNFSIVSRIMKGKKIYIENPETWSKHKVMCELILRKDNK